MSIINKQEPFSFQEFSISLLKEYATEGEARHIGLKIETLLTEAKPNKIEAVLSDSLNQLKNNYVCNPHYLKIFFSNMLQNYIINPTMLSSIVNDLSQEFARLLLEKNYYNTCEDIINLMIEKLILNKEEKNPFVCFQSFFDIKKIFRDSLYTYKKNINIKFDYFREKFYQSLLNKCNLSVRHLKVSEQNNNPLIDNLNSYLEVNMKNKSTPFLKIIDNVKVLGTNPTKNMQVFTNYLFKEKELIAEIKKSLDELICHWHQQYPNVLINKLNTTDLKEHHTQMVLENIFLSIKNLESLHVHSLFRKYPNTVSTIDSFCKTVAFN